MNKKNINLKLILALVALFIFCFQMAALAAQDQDQATVQDSGEAGNSQTAWDSDESNEVKDQELDDQIEEKEEELKNIENKIQTYERLIELKQQQQSSLSDQITMMEDEIAKMNDQVAKTGKEMDLVKLEIQALELKIREKDIDIQYKQKILSQLIKTIYDNSRGSSLELILKYDNLSDYFSDLENINKVNEKTKEVLDEINKAKYELQVQRDERRSKNDKLEKLKNDSLKNKFYLKSQQDAKEDILVETQGEEEKYQKMLERFEAQRQNLLGDIDDLANQKSGEISELKAKLKKPKTGLASTTWYYSQKDSRWAGDNIGMSRTKMSNYGCAVSCVAMVLKYHGVNIDPGTLAKQRIFYYDLIVWPNQWQSVQRASSTSHGNIDWDFIDEELENKNPVIVFVQANGRGAGHYVVIHNKTGKGDYVVHDPYWGANIYLNSTREYLSTLYGSSTSIDQMIVYHGKGGSYTDLAADEEEGEGDAQKDKEKEQIKKCEDSKGEWNDEKGRCECPGKKLKEKDGECIKKD